ncbi:hypothetical protein PGT21_022787 [Puccinia graminis f. sp. tritici]|uniref:Uncharacterized protein n=1 Tax=Puccinia graminis f. sp. tritici TaxID=56615 RepID=A0A5B0N4U8_PUCGR|nr:hypothetical protein PGT21_022787 [Puccinia graminis f. sp. tritici]
MDAIFGAKPNVTPCMQYDSVNGSNLYGSSDGSSPEVVYLGWEESQRAGEEVETCMRDGDETTMRNGGNDNPDSSEHLPADLLGQNLSGVEPTERAMALLQVSPAGNSSGIDIPNESDCSSNNHRPQSRFPSSSTNRSARASNAENTTNNNTRL